MPGGRVYDDTGGRMTAASRRGSVRAGRCRAGTVGRGAGACIEAHLSHYVIPHITYARWAHDDTGGRYDGCRASRVGSRCRAGTVGRGTRGGRVQHVDETF